MTPILESEIQLSSEVTEEDLASAIEDEFGVLYSKDGKRLLKCKSTLKTYSISNNTEVIYDRAFDFCNSLQQIEIPDSVKYIGYSAFIYCKTLKQIVLPDSLITIGKGMLVGSKSLQSIIVPKYKTDRYKNLLKYSNCDLSIIKEQDD